MAQTILRRPRKKPARNFQMGALTAAQGCRLCLSCGLNAAFLRGTAVAISGGISANSPEPRTSCRGIALQPKAPRHLLLRRANHQTERSSQKQAVSTVQNGISQSSASGKSVVFESSGAGNSVLPSSTKNSASSKRVSPKPDSGTQCQVCAKTKPVWPNMPSKSRWFRESILSLLRL